MFCIAEKDILTNADLKTKKEVEAETEFCSLNIITYFNYSTIRTLLLVLLCYNKCLVTSRIKRGKKSVI